MDSKSVPLQISCLGCKRYFLNDEKLPLESMTIQFKNYSFPIKESFLKDNILRTIVGFLNSKGGTIFMGINDSNGSVNGVSLGRKQMDEFKLMIKQMLQRIQPSVDLIKSEEVSVEFVPVLEGKEKSFYGKYIIKFIVLQGDPSKLYCLSQRIKISGVKMEDVEVISAYRRHNFGGVQEIKGIKVIHQIYQKARNPHRIANTFHQNCNPTPLCPMIIDRQKPQKPQRIFAEEIQKSVSSSSNSKHQNCEKKTLINIIKKDEKQKNEEKILIKREESIYLFFSNLRQKSINSFINFIRNSTVGKSSLQISYLNQIVRVQFSSQTQRQRLIEQLSKPSMKRLMDSFGNNGKVQIMLSYEVPNKDSENSDKTQKNQQKTYLLIFHGYNSGAQGSIQNYLQKCLTRTIQRKMKKTKQGLELEFKSRKTMFVFESMCKRSPHSNQLDRFWPKGKALITTSFRDESQMKIKETQHKLKDIVKVQKEIFFSLKQSPIKIQQLHQEQKDLELIATSLNPSQVSRLCNYFKNNMPKNTQKKLLFSKDNQYFRIVFNQTRDCWKFLQYCNSEKHRNLLAQFFKYKVMRIGIPGENLLIFPYNDHLKDQMQKIVLKVLGQGVIRNIAVKPFNNKVKVWSLSLVDESKLLDSYEKLENYLRKIPLFKVYLDYKELKESVKK